MGEILSVSKTRELMAEVLESQSLTAAKRSSVRLLKHDAALRARVAALEGKIEQAGGLLAHIRWIVETTEGDPQQRYDELAETMDDILAQVGFLSPGAKEDEG